MKYIHPHSESRIIDNAVLTVSASGLSNKFIALEAEKGMPNEATYISSPSEYTFNFGEPNYNKYGQSGLNAIQWLRAGGGLWVIRVVPDDETFAGLSIGIGYRANSEYANDEPEFKLLERTEGQIKVWNAYVAVSNGNPTMVKGRSSGNSVLLPKFYAGRWVKRGESEVFEPETSLGLLTEDEIAMLNVGIADDRKKYSPMAARRVSLVRNETIELKFEAKVSDTINSTDPEDENNYYVLHTAADEAALGDSKLGYRESSAMAVEIEIDDNGTAKRVSAVKIEEGTEATITVVAGFSALQANDVPSLLAAYVDGKTGTQEREASVGSKAEHDPSDESFWKTRFLSRLNELNPALSDGGSSHTADFINLLKTDIQGVGDTCIKGIITGSSINEWQNSYEVYHFDPKNYGDTDGTVRPISEKEMKSISINDKTSQPALSVVEYLDWLYANQLDENLFALGSQFSSTDGGNSGSALEDQNGNVIVTSQGFAIFADEMELRVLTAINTEVLISSPSTGYYDLQKLYFVNDENGNALSSKTSTDPEVAYYNLNNLDERWEAVDLNTAPNESQYVYGTSAYTTKPVVRYTMSSKISSMSEDNIQLFFSDNEGGDRTESFVATDLIALLKKVGGTNFMTFAPDENENGNTIVKFGNICNGKGYLSAAEYQTLVDESSDLANLFVEETPGKYVFRTTTFTASEFPQELISGSFRNLVNTEGTGMYLKMSESNTYLLNVEAINSWYAQLKTNSFLREMIRNADCTVEGDGDNGSTTVDIHYAPSYRSVFIDSDSLWGIRMVFDATALDTSFFTAKAAKDDPDHPVVITGKSTGEYAYYPERKVVAHYKTGGSKGNFEPNADYSHAGYNAIGFVATPYSVFDLQGSSYHADDDEVIEQRANSAKGRVVGSTLDKIQTRDIASLRPQSACYAEFLRFLPKGSGKWYNRLSVNLAYDDSMDRTYTEWSMFRLTISEKLDGGEVSREAFNVSLDPDAVSAAKESLFIEDVVNRFSKYLTCVVNYDNLSNFIDAKIGVHTDDNKPIEDEDGNEIVVPVDAVVKYIYNQIDLDQFNDRIFGEGYKETALAQYEIKSLMSAIGYDTNLCHLDTTLYDDEGEQTYLEPFVSLYLFQTLSSTNSLYLGGGSHGRGWGYEHENEEGELITNSTLEEALVKAYNGTTDAIVTNINLCVFDMVMDCNYPVMVKTAMNELSSVIRQDCVTILDQGISTANAQQAIDMRKNSMNYDTFYTSIFTQHLEITDEWSGKPVKVTPTFFLASKIPLNDTAYSPAVNFVGPNRGVVSGFNSVSWIPTEPEKDQLYRNQINYIERDNIATVFATELTTQTKNTPLTLIHAVRTLLRLRRSMVAVSRNYRSEFATSDVYGLLQTELNEIATSYVLAGGYEYITPVINTSDYDRQQRICRVDVDVAFTDIIERFAFNFIVNRV
jgi:hypothetical protein